MKKLEMLVLCRQDGTAIRLFYNYSELYLYIAHEENSKLLEDHPEFGSSRWSFLVLTPEFIIQYINTLKEEHDAKIMLEAWRRQLPLVEMCEGDLNNIHQVLVEPGINIESLREDWCRDWCEAHGMYIRNAP